jgi:hypothetical protein
MQEHQKAVDAACRAVQYVACTANTLTDVWLLHSSHTLPTCGNVVQLGRKHRLLQRIVLRRLMIPSQPSGSSLIVLFPIAAEAVTATTFIHHGAVVVVSAAGAAAIPCISTAPTSPPTSGDALAAVAELAAAAQSRQCLR